MRFFRKCYIMVEKGNNYQPYVSWRKRMSNITPMNREMKKNQLKRQVITNTGRNTDYEENSEEVVKKAKKQVYKKRLTILLALLLLLGAAALGYVQLKRYYKFSEYTIGWEKKLERAEGSFTGYINFGSNVLKYTKDGAAYIDEDGKEVWIQSYEMKSPIAAVNGDYAVIADQQGNSIYICDKSGKQGVATTLLPILKVTVSGKGVVAAILEDPKANYITMFKKDGAQLDITIKGLLGGEVGYPLDISLSPSGNQLIGSFAYIDSGLLKNKVAFYDFSEVGKNIPTRLVGGFHEIFDTHLVPEVVFLDDTYSCAFADNSLSFFSSRNAMSPELLKQELIEEEIRSIFYSSDYVGIIVNAASGESDYRMDAYRKNGEKLFSQELDYDYLSVDIDGDHILLYNEDSCQMYNMWGTLKFQGEFDFAVTKVTNGKYPNTLIVTGPQAMKEIKLQ